MTWPKNHDISGKLMRDSGNLAEKQMNPGLEPNRGGMDAG